MTLRRLPPADPRRFDAGWPTINRQPFVESQAYQRLKDELARYLTTGVRGRSFLIAGHRGSGKTALVRQVVEALHRDAFESAGRPEKSRTVQIQRPLLVQLHGPTLLSGKVAADEAGSKAVDPAGGLAASLSSALNRLVPEAATDSADKTALKDDVGYSALVQITIQLYRAVAAEFAESFTQHVQLAGLWRRRDLHELASQVRLDLDMGATAARLRRQWHAIDRLANGVLWPTNISAFGPEDQGPREIVALATAAQAFQVCAGKVDQSESTKRNASREDSVEAKADGGLKDLGTKLLSLASGLGIGAGAWDAGAGHLPAAILGVATALLGTTALSWASRREARSEAVESYSFLPDRSVQTLDRDLPMVIWRLRDVGLAPVFVIDELDKVDPKDIQPAIRRLIDRLKLLLTDHGFFCFLADRQYFDTLQWEINDNPRSLSSTYFNARLFVDYAPPQLAGYVRSIVTIGDPPDRSDELAQLVLAHQVLLRSRLNFIELGREISGLWAADGGVATPSAQIVGRSEYQVQVAVQMGVELVLRGYGLQARSAGDAAFGQMALDALYMIPRLWRTGRTTVRVRRADIGDYLMHILGLQSAEMESSKPDDGSGTNGGPLQADAALQAILGEMNLDVLAGAVAELAQLLSDFRALRAALVADAGLPPEYQPLISMLETMPAEGLLEQNGDLQYRFRLDQYGVNLDVSRLTRPGAEVPPSVAEEIRELADYLAALDSAAKLAGTDLEALVQARALPDTLVLGEIRLARDRLLRASFTSAAMGSDLLLMRGLRAAVRSRSTELALILQLVLALRRGCKRLKLTPGNELAALQRHMGEAWQAIGTNARLLEERVRGMVIHTDWPGKLVAEGLGLASLGEIDRWMATVKLVQPWSEREPGEGRAISEMQSKAWERWESHIDAMFGARTVVDQSVDFDDLVLAAAGRLPSALFRMPLDQMETIAWSALALESASTAAAAMDAGSSGSPGLPAPVWGVIAGLRALRFDGGKLREIARLLQDATAEAFAADVPPAEAGTLILLRDPALAAAVTSTDIPRLVVVESIGTRHLAAIEWLAANGVFGEAMAYE